MSELPEPKFRKTKSDKWAVMAPVVTLEAALAGDGKVQVLKKSGGYSSFTVGSLGKPFDVDGVQMCYGYAPEDSEGDSGSNGSGSTGSGSTGSGAGDGASRAPRSAPGRRSRPIEPPPDDVAAPRFDLPEPPPRDETEPLPEYQGEDHWDNGF